MSGDSSSSSLFFPQPGTLIFTAACTSFMITSMKNCEIEIFSFVDHSSVPWPDGVTIRGYNFRTGYFKSEEIKVVE